MATNKHAVIRYNELDKCFQNKGRNFTFNDLLDSCNDALVEFDPKADGIKRRQLYEDLKFMQSEQGWSIELDDNAKFGRKKIYRYLDPKFSIANSPLNEDEANQLKLAMLTLDRFNFEWVDELSLRLKNEFKLPCDSKKVIEFEENEYLRGREHLIELYNTIIYKTVIRINYKSFKSNQSQQIIIHPYYLKQYNNRWFLFGKNENFKNITILALDRIVSFEKTDKKYLETSLDFKDHLDDIVGVTLKVDRSIEKVILKVNKNHWPYIETKPLHHSQTKFNQNDSHVYIYLKVIPNYELETLLFQHGEQIQVIEPIEFMEHFSFRVKQLSNLYKNTADQMHSKA